MDTPTTEIYPLSLHDALPIYISSHILAFVLAFARGLHIYIPQQLRRVWAKPTDDLGVVPLPGSTALIVGLGGIGAETARDRKSTRLNSSHQIISYADFCLKKR